MTPTGPPWPPRRKGGCARRSVRDADGGASVRAQVESDIMRVIVEMFGVKGSDQRMSVWSVFQYFNVRDRRPRCIH